MIKVPIRIAMVLRAVASRSCGCRGPNLQAVVGDTLEASGFLVLLNTAATGALFGPCSFVKGKGGKKMNGSVDPL